MPVSVRWRASGDVAIPKSLSVTWAWAVRS
jgi:hypothetical protein